MRKYVSYLSLIGLVLFLLIQVSINACSEGGTNPEDEKFILPDSNLSFYDDVEPLFQVRCGLESGCHSPSDIDNRLLYTVLVNKIALMNHQLRDGKRLVFLDEDMQNPDNAPLYLVVLEGYPEPFYDKMPPPWDNKKPLTDNQINGIKQWIREGAKD
jgi:hypothetical protein